MKKKSGLIVLINFIFFVILSSGISFARPVTSDPGWPRMFEADGNKVVVYQPQLEKWENHEKLFGKAAVAVQLKDNDKTFYGALSLRANSAVNLDSRTVFLNNFQITNQVFPNIEEKLARKCAKAVEAALPDGKSIVISLDRILAGLEGTKKKAKGVELNLKPPPDL